METVLLFVVAPAAIFVILGLPLLVVKPKLQPEPYKLGDPWPYGPIWWSAVEEHGHGHASHADEQPIGGSASATW
ncbi:aa3-type cytochrome oxidase subunit CtaJ [Hoyosella rhizosphaerae]|uniref:Uncharacterized protein n=1 Tax=Hoyosella rhizosphaerae TaxID=1755582 RepID=A0A916XGW8_9ACTN|nr:hypothetical protein [Hoyosella rhizosphaerae]GGC72504.1 hypothetical protein GCM10011410_26970 [Hoyosella rhizosphaerae]